MSENTYVDIAFEAREKREPFRFKIGEGEGRKEWSEKFELPTLDDPGLPIEILAAAAQAAGTNGGLSNDADAIRIIVEYFQRDHPQLVRALNRHSQAHMVLIGLIEQWTEFSSVDPKA